MQQRGWNRPAEHRQVFAAWDRVVPDGIGRRTRPISFRNGRLLVLVESAPLYEELRCFRAGELLRLLNHDLAGHESSGEGLGVSVRQIEFKRN